ncbi:MAG: tetratricopeptide repeat protein [Armatimonas sp.]
MFLGIPASRWSRAGVAFVLGLLTAGILWRYARREGRAEALRPTPAPTDVPTVFTEPRLNVPETRLAELLRERSAARTVEEKNALASALADFARRVHFQSAAGSIVSLTAFNAALRLRREAGDRRGQADILQSRAETQAMLGKPELAKIDLQEALTISQKSADAALQQAVILYLLGELERQSGHYDSARSYLDRSLAIRQANQERNGEADCLRALGQVSYEEGQYALARRSLTEAIGIYSSLGKAQSRAAALGQLGDVALAQGAAEEASQFYDEGLAIWRKANQEFWIGRFLARQAELALRRNQPTRAEQLAQESMALLERSNGPMEAAWAREVLGKIALCNGNQAEGRRLLEQAHGEFARLGKAYSKRRVERILKAN